MAVAESDLTVDDLDSIYPKRQMEDTTRLNRLKSLAVDLTNGVYGGSVRSQPEIEGNPVNFALFVWAHYLALREGEPASESQSGGSIAYARANTRGQDASGLTETRYGRQALNLLGDNASIGIEKANSSWD